MEHSTLSARPSAEGPEQRDEAQPARLDLSHMAPPEDLDEVRLEELTIDGICGVY